MVTLFEDPTATASPANSLLKGYQVSSDAAARRDQFQLQQQELAQKQQTLAQQQAIMRMGQEAARTFDPRAIAMYSAANPEGGAALRNEAKYFVGEGNAIMQSIRDAKITDRPVIYKMGLQKLSKIPNFDTSNYPAEYDPALVDPLPFVEKF